LVAALLEASERFDPDRLYQEAVLIAARGDVREELDRLAQLSAAHVAQAQAMLKSGEAVGRPARSNIGLELKGAVEQFRDQVQNLE